MRKKAIATPLAAILTALLLLFLTGCGGGNGTGKTRGTGGVNDILEKGMAAEDQRKSGQNGTEQGNPGGQNNPDDQGSQSGQNDPGKQGDQGNPDDRNDPDRKGEQGNSDDPGNQGGQGNPGGADGDVSYDHVDIDLTELSDTVVYAEVYDMLMNPQDYLGKVVKMDGIFYVADNPAANDYYYMCIVQDVTACCMLDIEFVLDGTYVYPNDYPELDTEITVVGVFDTYLEDGKTYCTLRRAKLL